MGARDTDWAIYPAREDTFLLLPFARASKGEKVADVGTGNGLLALTAARTGARVVATDLNRHALAVLRARAIAEGTALETVRTDLLAGLERFDRILANPPYLPTRPDSREPEPGDRLALDGGPDGLRVTRRLFETLDQHLTPTGRAFLLTSTLQDRDGLAQILGTWLGQGGSVERVASRSLEGERLEVLACARGPPGRVPGEDGGSRRGAPAPGSPRPSPGDVSLSRGRKRGGRRSPLRRPSRERSRSPTGPR